MSHFYSSLEDPLAGVGGVEPPITESKSVALPLGDTPTIYLYYHIYLKKSIYLFI